MGDTFGDKAITCEGDAFRGDLGVHTSYSCLSHVDIGSEYNWYSGANVAVWRGDTDKHCYLCKLDGNSSSWKFTDSKGAVSYAVRPGTQELAHEDHDDDDDNDDDDDDDADADEEEDDEHLFDEANHEDESDRKDMERFEKHVE